jgi:hypothetical protein
MLFSYESKSPSQSHINEMQQLTKQISRCRAIQMKQHGNNQTHEIRKSLLEKAKGQRGPRAQTC